MITRFAGLTPTRSRAVAHGDLVFTVAVAPDPVSPSMYEQSVKVLARIDESLALCGTDKSKILSAIVYITDIKHREAVGRVRREFFKGDPPANTLLVITALADPAFLVEIEAIVPLP